MAADDLVAVGPARPGRRAGDPFQGVAVRFAAVSVAYHAGRDRLAGPGGPAVLGEPQGAARSGAGGLGNGIAVVPAGRGGGDQRPPSPSPIQPTIGPPTGVEPRQATAHNDITRPRMAGVAESWSTVLASELNEMLP